MSQVKEIIERLERNLNTFSLNKQATKGQPAEEYWYGCYQTAKDILILLRPLAEEPPSTELSERLTDIINKHFRVVCHTNDGIKAQDIIDILSESRDIIDRQAAELKFLKNEKQEKQD